MKYVEFINKVKDIALAIDEENDVAFVMPDYRYLINLSGLNIDSVEDFYGLNYDIVYEVLKLEADAYNATHNSIPYIAGWLKNILQYGLSPAEERAQTELFKDIIEYSKQKNVDLAKQEAAEEMFGTDGLFIGKKTPETY